MAAGVLFVINIVVDTVIGIKAPQVVWMVGMDATLHAGKITDCRRAACSQKELYLMRTVSPILAQVPD
jgi:hypothetical protein